MYWFNKHSKHPCINVTLHAVSAQCDEDTAFYPDHWSLPNSSAADPLHHVASHRYTQPRVKHTNQQSHDSLATNGSDGAAQNAPLGRFDFITKTSTKKLHKNNNNNNKTTSKVCTCESSISVRLKESIQGVNSIANNMQIRGTSRILQLTFPVCEFLLFPALIDQNHWSRISCLRC